MCEKQKIGSLISSNSSIYSSIPGKSCVLCVNGCKNHNFYQPLWNLDSESLSTNTRHLAFTMRASNNEQRKWKANLEASRTTHTHKPCVMYVPILSDSRTNKSREQWRNFLVSTAANEGSSLCASNLLKLKKIGLSLGWKVGWWRRTSIDISYLSNRSASLFHYFLFHLLFENATITRPHKRETCKEWKEKRKTENAPLSPLHALQLYE